MRWKAIILRMDVVLHRESLHRSFLVHEADITKYGSTWYEGMTMILLHPNPNFTNHI